MHLTSRDRILTAHLEDGKERQSESWTIHLHKPNINDAENPQACNDDS